MPESTNKVKFGLSNVHYAMLESVVNGFVTYAKPKPWPGAVNLSLSPLGETTKFYADDGTYWMSPNNDGYEGDYESALVPDSFALDALGEKLILPEGVQVEYANVEGNAFALLFEFKGDKKAIRHILYNCTAARSNVAGSTVTNTKTPTTSSLKITAAPLPNGMVKSKSVPTTTSATYANWYSKVWQPLLELEVTSQAGTEPGTTALAVIPDLAEGNSYKTKIGAAVTLPPYGATLTEDWTDWDGKSPITAENGQQIAVVEVNSDNVALAGGVATVTANGG